MRVQVYSRNLLTPALDTDLTDMAESVTFSTKIPGGFGICTFSFATDYFRAYQFLTTKMLYHLIITDYLTDISRSRVLFEGRIEDISLSGGIVNVTALGYCSSMADELSHAAYSGITSDVLKAALATSCPEINPDQLGIAATNSVIQSTAGESYLDISTQELTPKLLNFSDSTGARFDWAVWDNRKFYLKPRAPTAINWRVNLSDFTTFELGSSIVQVYNRVYGLYRVGTTLTRTPVQEDLTSQAKYDVIREYTIPDMGAVTLDTANAAVTAYLKSHKEPRPTLSNVALGAWATDANGVRCPSSWVRAGEVLRVRDLVPASGDLGSVVMDNIRTFFITETEYDAQAGENRLTFEGDKQSVDAIIARM